MMTYFHLQIRLDSAERWLLWYDDGIGPDRAWMDDSGHIPLFNSTASLDRYAANQGIAAVQATSVLYDLDVVSRWLSDPRPDAVKCDAFLGTWNFLSEAAGTADVKLPEYGTTAGAVYKKLWRGINYPSLTPPGHHYVPEWSVAELDTLREILAFGLSFLRSRLESVP